MKSNISKHQKFFLKMKKKRTTRKTRGFVVGAKILHLVQTHSKRTNTIVTRDEYERKTIDDKTLVCAKPQRELELSSSSSRLLKKHRRDFGSRG